ncbi:PaaX family transcriptional regulator C-terminal domain-containing protein [Saccharopolyspora shandongensis]|uniref:PaaX family transcriptional regulator C-terminal domain-containing protein n=1 Tax=Saccharopolyspora shandongensis TaxID=418495 RepID=UPI0033EDB113
MANPLEPHVREVATELGVTDYVTTLTTTDLTIGNIVAPRELAERLWSLDRVAADHRRLLDIAEHSLQALRGATHIEALTIAIELTAAFTNAVEPDPLLPPQLLPQPWVGTAARAAVAACWSELLKSKPSEKIRLFRWYSDVAAEVSNPMAAGRGQDT